MSNTATLAKPDQMENARRQAQAQFNSIKEMVDALNAARESGDQDAIEAADQRIQEDALSAEIRYGWHSPGTSPKDTDCEYRILLCTGGPAVQITGELGAFNEPETAEIECQDWFTPWTYVAIEGDDVTETLLTYARCFYFGG